MNDAVKIVRITRRDWERIQRRAQAFEPFHQGLTRALDTLDEYEQVFLDNVEDEEDNEPLFLSHEVSSEVIRRLEEIGVVIKKDEDPSEGWDDDERLRPEPEHRETEDLLRLDEELRREAKNG